MKLSRQFLILAILISTSSMFGQLIINDEFTSKGMAPEGTFQFEEGTTIPNLRFKNLKSEFFNLHEKLDKLTIIEFWYTRCKFCVDKKEYIQKFSIQYDINIVSISIDEKPSTVRSYLADKNIDWDNIHDNNAFKSFFQTTLGDAYPIYIIVTPDKEIVRVLDDKTSIGRMGVYLQKYFK